MATGSIRREKASQQIAARNYSFTVVFEPVGSGRGPSGNGSRKVRGNKLEVSGYQVTVPLLPGLITYGRTLAEAREMARDAIRCHLEGLKKDGERIPDEKNTIQGFEWHSGPDLSARPHPQATRGVARVAEGRVRDSSPQRESCAIEASGETTTAGDGS